MSVTRRQFLRAGGSAVMVVGTGCDRLATMGLGPFGESVLAGIRPPAHDEIDLERHVLNRLSFGVRPGDYDRAREMGVEAYIEEQLHPERIEDGRAARAVRRFESLDDPAGELFEYKPAFLLDEMTRGTVLRAVMSERQLQEMMVSFWSDHFNIDVTKGDCQWLKAADDREVIRRHALGNFGDLLRASALSPAMLWYLDGRVNRKEKAGDRPNENYARELLELHTLGIHGGYTQRDVMETARCLTGWTVRSGAWFKNGSVAFHADAHDDGEKVVLGDRIPAGGGEGDLDRVLRIAANHPSTGRHIALKLCERFVSEEPSEGLVREVAGAFMAGEAGEGSERRRGDIKETLRTLFASEEFRQARGVKFKRPFRFLVSALRGTDAKTNASSALVDYLVRMGQGPFQYPTPDGYPEEASPWMGTLLWRWHFAVALSEGRIVGTKVDAAGLVDRADGEAGLVGHLFGRRATEGEMGGYRASGAGLAFALASPGFQWC